MDMKKIHIKPGAMTKKRLETMNTSAAPGCRQFRRRRETYWQ